MLNDWIIEHSDTIGTGDINLTGAISLNQAKFKDGLQSGNVYYSWIEGANREAGIAVFDGNNALVRSTVQSTLVNGVFNDVNPVPLAMGGEAIVSGTFNTAAYQSIIDELANHETRISANATAISNIEASSELTPAQIDALNASSSPSIINPYVTQAAVTQIENDLTILDADVSFRESAITALENGGDITTNSDTVINIAAGNGEVIDSYSDTEDQATSDVAWPSQVYNLLTEAGMPVVTGLGFTSIGVDISGTIVNAPNGFSSAQRRDIIILGEVEYFDRVIDSVTFAPIVSNQSGNTLNDLIEYIDFGTRVKGLVVRPTEIGDLSYWRDAGTVFSVGINFANAKNDPNVGHADALGSVSVAVVFNPVLYNDGTTISNPATTVIDSEQFEEDGSGVLTTIANGKTVIHYLFESFGNHPFMSYGQQEYATHADAITNLFADRATHLFPVELGRMVLLAQVVVDKSSTAWGLTAEIFPIGASTSSGSGVGTASQAINVGYTDTYGIGNNVQSATDSLAAIKLSPDQHASIDASSAGLNPPTAINPLATIGDIPSDDHRGRNFLVNGQLTVWQRGDSFTGLGYTADHWNTTNASVDCLRGESGNGRYMQITATDAFSGIRQYIEEGVRLGGRQMALSFFWEVISGDTSTAYIFFQSGNDTSNTVGIPDPLVTGFKVVTLLLSEASDINNLLQMQILSNSSAATNTVVRVYNLQLEIGDDFSTYDIVAPADQLMKCRRYYRISEASGQAAEFAHDMFATPTESGAGPYGYEAELG